MNHQNLIDIKVLFTCLLFYIFNLLKFSFENVEIVMKTLVFILTVGYTARRWYLLEKNKKE